MDAGEWWRRRYRRCGRNEATPTRWGEACDSEERAWRLERAAWESDGLDASRRRAFVVTAAMRLRADRSGAIDLADAMTPGTLRLFEHGRGDTSFTAGVLLESLLKRTSANSTAEHFRSIARMTRPRHTGACLLSFLQRIHLLGVCVANSPQAIGGTLRDDDVTEPLVGLILSEDYFAVRRGSDFLRILAARSETRQGLLEWQAGSSSSLAQEAWAFRSVLIRFPTSFHVVEALTELRRDLRKDRDRPGLDALVDG